MKKIQKKAVELVREWLSRNVLSPAFGLPVYAPISVLQIMILDIIENASYQTLVRDKDDLMKVFPLDEVAELKFEVVSNSLNTMRDVSNILCIEESFARSSSIVYLSDYYLLDISNDKILLTPKGKSFVEGNKGWLQSKKTHIRASIEEIINPLFERIDSDYIANAWGLEVWDELLKLPTVHYCYTNIGEVHKDSYDYNVPNGGVVSRFVMHDDCGGVSNNVSNIHEETSIYIKPESKRDEEK
jgi:hypothetical protein